MFALASLPVGLGVVVGRGGPLHRLAPAVEAPGERRAAKTDARLCRLAGRLRARTKIPVPHAKHPSKLTRVHSQAFP
jgi:hypothetical protein